MRITCNICGQQYSPKGGGHCRGGAYGGCCRTFSSDRAGDKHRVGPYDPPGLRRCLTDEEMATLTRKDGTIIWRLTNRGWTNEPPRPDATWPKKGREDD